MQQLKDAFVSPKKLKIYLAPPLLARPDKVTSEPRKIQFGAWILTAFKLIKKFKFLRGSALDVFSYTAERRMERHLRDEFIAHITEMLPKLTTENKALAIEIVELSNSVRGFGHVKHNNYLAYQNQLAVLLERFNKPDPGNLVSKIQVEVAQVA